MDYKVTIIMPCFGRPTQTIRAIRSILNQTEKSWEAFVIGDNCEIIADIIESKQFDTFNQPESKLVIENLPKNYGFWGSYIRNEYVKKANGKYVVFLDNDDYFLENHLKNYLKEIENTDLDFVYYNTWLINNGERNTRLEKNHIGHSEIIIKTEFLKKIDIEDNNYGHDWNLIEKMINLGANSKKGISRELTYRIMGYPNYREEN
jgi:glycosyltransferase involved in cell wall biosynthesis